MSGNEVLRSIEQESGMNNKQPVKHVKSEITNYWHVRINPKRTKVMKDFSIFQTDIIKTRQGRWDKDSKNRIAVGDHLGFITGPVGEELVFIFKIIGEESANERPNHWASSTPYTDNNGMNSVADRKVIILTNKHSLPKTFEWREFRRSTGLGGECASWAPRGTQRVDQKKFILPW